MSKMAQSGCLGGVSQSATINRRKPLIASINEETEAAILGEEAGEADEANGGSAKKVTVQSWPMAALTASSQYSIRESVSSQ